MSLQRCFCSLCVFIILLVQQTVVTVNAQEQRVDTLARTNNTLTVDAINPSDILSLKNGITFTNADTSTQVTMRFRMQNLAQAQTVSAEDLRIDRHQWLVRRVRLRLNGFVLDPGLTFLLQLSFSRGDIDWENTEFPNILRDVVVQWQPLRNSPAGSLQVGFGLTKLPGNRQRVVSSGEMQMIDRSIVNREFNVDRDFGFFGVYSNTLGGMRYNLRAALTTGAGRNPQITSRGMALTYRVELLPLGAFEQNGDYFEGDLLREKTPKLSLAAGYSHNNGALRTGGQTGQFFTRVHQLGTFIADALLKYQGLSVYAEYMNRTSSDPIERDASTGQTRYAYIGDGINIQAGYFVAPHVEVVARYSKITPQPEIQAFARAQEQFIGGVSWYLNRHRVKVQADITFDRVITLPANTARESWIGRFQVELGI